MSPTQELKICILRRQCSPASKNRTRKKKSTVEDASKIPEQNKKKKRDLRIPEISRIIKERKG